MRRVFKNAGMLLGGRVLAGLCALGYLAIAARTLGLEGFGTLILVHTYVLLLNGLVNFKSWQAVIRYGAGCLEDGRHSDFHRLLGFTTALDVVSAVFGTVVAMAAAPLVGPLMGWSSETISFATWYSLLVLVSITATPIGLLRLFDRFDVIAAQTLITPVLRLMAVIYAWSAGWGLGAFLVIWFISGFAGRVALMALGWRELWRRPELRRNFRLAFRGVAAAHPGIWKFVWATNIHTTIELVTGHLTTLIVGWAMGPAAAGIYRVAQEFSVVLTKPSMLLKQAIYPDLAKLATRGDGRGMGRLLWRSGLVSGSGATGILLFAVLFGEVILEASVGPEFIPAYGVLVLLVLAATVEVFGFALNPVMYALGRPGISLKVNALSMAVYLPLLLVLLDRFGLVGGGFAMVGASALFFGLMAVIATRLLRSVTPDHPAVPAPPPRRS